MGTYGVAVVGHAFMGRAHSNAWRNVGAFYPDVPRTVRGPGSVPDVPPDGPIADRRVAVPVAGGRGR